MSEINDRAAHLLGELQAAVDIRPFDAAGQQAVHGAFANLPAEEVNYGTTVTYLLQQIHGYHFPGVTDRRGYYFSPDNGASVCPFTIARRPSDDALTVVVISARGPQAVAGILTLANVVREADPLCAFHIKKPPGGVTTDLLRRCKPDQTPWNPLAAFEDDTYPNVILSVPDLTAAAPLSDGFAKLHEPGGPYRKVKYGLRRLERQLRSVGGHSLAGFTQADYTPARWDTARRIIDWFFAEKDTRGHLSKPVDYYNMFAETVAWRPDADSVVRAFTCFEGNEVGLVAAERIGASSTFGVYSLLSQRIADWTFSDLQTVMLMHCISDLGGTHADLGGAETESLQRFHAKFLPARTKQETKPEMERTTSPWLELA